MSVKTQPQSRRVAGWRIIIWVIDKLKFNQLALSPGLGVDSLYRGRLFRSWRTGCCFESHSECNAPTGLPLPVRVSPRPLF